MSWIVRKPFVAAFYGTSLTTGRLSTFWVERLAQELRGVPEALGQVILYNLGKGSQTSDWGAANAYTVAQLRPDFILSEDFTINDCFEVAGVPQVSQAQQETNMQAMHDAWVAANPDVDITWQSMSSVDVGVSVGRPTLAARYANGLVKAAAMGDRVLDNYLAASGLPVPPGVAGGWTKPLPNVRTQPVAGSIEVTDGYGEMPGGTTWNPADKSANIALSGGNLAATSTAGSAWLIARATQAVPDKTHIELVANVTVDVSYPSFGLANAAHPLNSALGLGNDSIGVYRTGQVQIGGVVVGSAGFTYGAGDTIAIEVDLTNAVAYFMKGGVRTGFSIAAIAGAVYPAIGFFDAGATGTLKVTGFGDGLHPTQAATNQFLMPNAKFWCRQRMADLYGLAAPVP